ncbi:MAG: SDR family oxidoreductase [Actinomycetia bacterium]|nr:SDR family oxidoreductase [Actinomycetes bacterium]
MGKFDLAGKTAIITGATKGIGLGIAKAFAENGAELALIGRDVKSGEKALSEIKNISKKRSMFYNCDVGEYIQVKKTCDLILSDFSRVDILVCNAGWTVRAPLKDMDIKIWDKAIAVNLNGVFYFIRSLINSMLDNKYGNIIIVGSSVTWNGAGGGLHYPATKAALSGIIKGLSYEFLSQGIRANIISPALIDTPMLRERYPDDEKTNKMLAAQVPVGRIGKPEDIGNLALFLASDESGYIVGQEIVADGGRILYKHPAGS